MAVRRRFQDERRDVARHQAKVISAVALADQIGPEFNVSDQDIEFNDDALEATDAKF